MKITDLKVIQVSHSNVYTFLMHLQKSNCPRNGRRTARIHRDVKIRRRRRNVICRTTPASGHASTGSTTRRYSKPQFLRAISDSLGACTEAFQFSSDDNSDDDDDVDSTPSATATASVTAAAATATLQHDMYKVCRIATRYKVVLVPCVTFQLCGSCERHAQWLNPFCRTPIEQDLRVFVWMK